MTGLGPWKNECAHRSFIYYGNINEFPREMWELPKWRNLLSSQNMMIRVLSVTANAVGYLSVMGFYGTYSMDCTCNS